MIKYGNLLSAGFPVYRALIQLGVFSPRCVDGIDVDHWHLLVQHLVKDRGQMEMKFKSSKNPHLPLPWDRFLLKDIQTSRTISVSKIALE